MVEFGWRKRRRIASRSSAGNHWWHRGGASPQLKTRISLANLISLPRVVLEMMSGSDLIFLF